MSKRIILLVLFWGFLCNTYAQNNFYVAAPGTFRLNAEETIAVAIEGNKNSIANVYVQEYPGKRNNIIHRTLEVQPDKPQIFKVLLNSTAFPPKFLSSPGSPKLVSVTAVIDNFRKEILVPITTQSGYVFLQMDKPIYTPDQRAQMRIISLNEAGMPSDKNFKLQIKNPDGIVVEEKSFNEKAEQSLKAFVKYTYKFPTYPVLGEWSATVRYGYEYERNTTTYFELQEYVLPTFTVEVKTPEVILPDTTDIKIEVLAQHVYGKKVQGLVTFRVGIKRGLTTTFFAIIGPKELNEGVLEQKLKTEDLKAHNKVGWFPAVDGSQLVVEATVVDDATGNNEKATNMNTRFSKTPFVISFKRCLSDFKPGLNSIFEAEITYMDGKPAPWVYAKINATADGKPLHIREDSKITDENGLITFEIQPEMHHNTVSVTLETTDPRYPGSQAIGSFVQRRFVSATNAYISISRSTALRLKPGDTFSKLIHFEPIGIQHIYYMIVSKGKIIDMQKLPPGEFKEQSLKFQITYEMVPSFRLLVFSHYRNELIADSLKVDVERVCDPKAEVTIENDFQNKEPGAAGTINLRGTPGTWVGLLGVDEAVYALSKKDLLTKAKMFDLFASHDLGCGPGGGMTVKQVLGNAGITIGTNIYTPTLDHRCGHINRKKREAEFDIVSTYGTKSERQCCALGVLHDRYNRTCEERLDVVVRELEGEYNNCSTAFFDCCKYAEEHDTAYMFLLKSLARQAGAAVSDLDFIPANQEDALERATLVRNDFRETWIFEDLKIGSDGRKVHEVSLPHSITTWVISGVAVSPQNGMCIAEPQKLISFKKIFLHLNLPYSVVRTEQVEIQATVFNYGDKVLPATVYMYGVKDLCTGVQPGKKSERKQVTVKPYSAETVSFSAIPFTAETFKIKVAVITPQGSDVIEKDLRVVTEGVPKEIDVPIKLDPTNQQGRANKIVETKLYKDTIDPTRNLQVTSIKLAALEGFVPGTASCSITAMGDRMGPVVQTAIKDPKRLLRHPGGCGEQNMMRLAPTLYTMKYLKATGKLTFESERKGYDYIYKGYANQLQYRKYDGSFACFRNDQASTWLTAFVAKVFCQANKMADINANVMCGAVKWLINNQQPDGSFVEGKRVIHQDMLGGVHGSIPLTAFVLIAFGECDCNIPDLALIKGRAMKYLETRLASVYNPLPVAIVAYALALSDSKMKQAANDKLLSLAIHNRGENLLYWSTGNTAQDIETAGYGLLTQLLFHDLVKSISIVNWMNRYQRQSGHFHSTQDTVLALQSLAEFAIQAPKARLNLVANITSSNDRNLHKMLTFQENNALVLQTVKVDKIGGTLFINTTGNGVASLTMKLCYKLYVPPEKLCKFDVTINLSDPTEDNGDVLGGVAAEIRNRDKDILPPERIRGVVEALDAVPELDNNGIDKGLQKGANNSDVNPRNNGDVNELDNNRKDGVPEDDDHKHEGYPEYNAKARVRRQQPVQNGKLKYNISICVKYLGTRDTEMSIVDVGLFSGFKPKIEALKKIVEDPKQPIKRYEKSSRGVVFYLETISHTAKYCFSFPVIREYIVGKTQTSVVKVYDYYRPDESCTKFYSPPGNSSILHAICEGKTCECAQGGCPTDRTLEVTASLVRDERSRRIQEIACNNYDYVWKGRLNAPPRKQGGFWSITFTVDEVLKEGIEKKNIVQGNSRTLLLPENCAEMVRGQTYLIMSKDGEKYENSEGAMWHRYMLDQTSVVHMWTSIQESRNPELQRALDSVVKTLAQQGCPV